MAHSKRAIVSDTVIRYLSSEGRWVFVKIDLEAAFVLLVLLFFLYINVCQGETLDTVILIM